MHGCAGVSREQKVKVQVTKGWWIRSELRLYSEERRKAVGTDEKSRKRTKKTNETTSPVTGG